MEWQIDWFRYLRAEHIGIGRRRGRKVGYDDSDMV
jgi:hypothetical protein